MRELTSTEKTNRIELLTSHLLLLLIVGIWLAYFWPMMAGKTVVGFRDSVYLYYPYFKWIDSQWAAGQIPLWNPYCDLGHPVVADGTSSVFYPGKLVFFLRFLSYPSRYGIYIAMHVLIAAVGARCLSQRLGATSIAAALAGVSYAFGGSVLFQTTNVVYLVSASLLPFGLIYVWQMFRRAGLNSAIAAGLFCALMVLGGDPQMAYLTGLIAVATFVARVIGMYFRGIRIKRIGSSASRLLLIRGLSRLAAMAFAMFVLSAVQVLPTYYWAKQSERESSRVESLASLLSKAESGSELDATLQFSQSPWSIAELSCPNFSGRPFPVNQRWASSLPGADRIWTPSLYVGLATMLLALGSFRLWGRERRKVWLTRLCLFFCLGSFGWFGAVWFYNEIVISLGGDGLQNTGEHVGGVYWFMLVCLPKFYVFRYPAKLFVVSSLAICVLASLALNRKVPRWPAVAAAALSAAGIIVLTFHNPFKQLSFADQMFGPFCSDAGYSNLYFSFVQMFVVVVGFLLFDSLGRTACRSITAKRFSAAGLLFLAAAELLVANYWLVPQIDAEMLEGNTPIMLELETLAENTLPSRIVRSYGTPSNWKMESSANRLEEIVKWQRETLHPKNNLSVDCRLFGSFASIDNCSNRRFSGILIRKKAVSDDAVNYANQFQVSGSTNFGGGLTADIQPGNESGLWFVPVKEDLKQLDRDWPEILSSNRVLNWQYQLLEFSSRRIRIQLVALEPAVVIFNSLPEAGWRCKVRSVHSEELIENSQLSIGSEYFLAVRLPTGELEIEFEYSPIEFWIGAWISAAGWLAMAVCWLRKQLR